MSSSTITDHPERPGRPDRPDRQPVYPARYREDEARGRGIGRALLRLTGTSGTLDETLMDRLGAALLERDEAGDRLARAMRRSRIGDPERVTNRQLTAVLNDPQGLHRTDSEDPLPPTLRAFMDEVCATPGWVQWDRVERGAAAYRYLGRNAYDVLLGLSLIGGYRFGGPADFLVRTGGLDGDTTLRRLAETQQWTNAMSKPGAMRPGAEGWRLTVHVRVMHALMNARFEADWDTGRWGLPVNQADQAGTLACSTRR